MFNVDDTVIFLENTTCIFNYGYTDRVYPCGSSRCSCEKLINKRGIIVKIHNQESKYDYRVCFTEYDQFNVFTSNLIPENFSIEDAVSAIVLNHISPEKGEYLLNLLYKKHS